MNNQDYRQWPNILALNAEIERYETLLDEALLEKDRVYLRRKLHELISKKYDQIQFNKELFKKEGA